MSACADRSCSRRVFASTTGFPTRRPQPTRAVEALFASRPGARQGLPRSQRRVYPLRMMPATTRPTTSPRCAAIPTAPNGRAGAVVIVQAAAGEKILRSRAGSGAIGRFSAALPQDDRPGCAPEAATCTGPSASAHRPVHAGGLRVVVAAKRRIHSLCPALTPAGARPACAGEASPGAAWRRASPFRGGPIPCARRWAQSTGCARPPR
jgi:hypothetical protein